jgi:hypothetical protein
VVFVGRRFGHGPIVPTRPRFEDGVAVPSSPMRCLQRTRSTRRRYSACTAVNEEQISPPMTRAHSCACVGSRRGRLIDGRIGPCAWR